VLRTRWRGRRDDSALDSRRQTRRDLSRICEKQVLIAIVYLEQRPQQASRMSPETATEPPTGGIYSDS